MIVNNSYLLTGEIYGSVDYCRLQTVQVFEQLQSGTEMYDGLVKCDMGLLFFDESYQLPLNVLFVQKGKLIVTYGNALIEARIFVQGIIIA